MTINIFLVVALVAFTAFLIIYGLYIILVFRNPKTKKYIDMVNQALMKPLNRQSLPDVTVIVPTYNEEAVISRKLQNIAELDYPMERIEVLLIDDCSTDRTREIAQNMFRELGLSGKIIRNLHRMGVNASYNRGIPIASSDLILRTDADVNIEADALEKAVKILSEIKNVGGISGTTPPVVNKNTAATMVEKSYKTLYDQMSIAESAIHSTFPGGGGFALLKKSVFSPISINSGSTDGNISLSIVRKGFRYLWVPQTFSREIISHQFNEQVRQKIRRASRLIQSAIMNRDILFRREFQGFGMLIFPLRFAMLTICPVLMVVGLFCTFFSILSYSVLLAVFLTFGFCLFLYLGLRIRMGVLNSVTSLVFHQFYLLLSLLFLGKNMSTWKRAKKRTAT